MLARLNTLYSCSLQTLFLRKQNALPRSISHCLERGGDALKCYPLSGISHCGHSTCTCKCTHTHKHTHTYVQTHFCSTVISFALGCTPAHLQQAHIIQAITKSESPPAHTYTYAHTKNPPCPQQLVEALRTDLTCQDEELRSIVTRFPAVLGACVVTLYEHHYL